MSEINNGHWLTALDRTYMFAHMIEECLLTELVIKQHDEFRNIVQQVCDRLRELYQKIPNHPDWPEPNK